jgi:DNA-binding XRE family transcriptional regulator
MVNDMTNEKAIDTFSDYMNDETRVSPSERERINFEISLIGKMIEAREEKGLSQRELAEISGVKQPAIARLESMKSTPQIDTLFMVLQPLGYTIEIVPLHNRA